MTKVQEFIQEKCGEGGEYVLDERAKQLEVVLRSVLSHYESLLCNVHGVDALDIAMKSNSPLKQARFVLAENVSGEAELLERFYEWLAEDRKIRGLPDPKHRIMELEVKLQDLRGALKVWEDSNYRQRKLRAEAEARNKQLETALNMMVEAPTGGAIMLSRTLLAEGGKR